jgi:hypothetical protein
VRFSASIPLSSSAASAMTNGEREEKPRGNSRVSKVWGFFATLPEVRRWSLCNPRGPASRSRHQATENFTIPSRATPNFRAAAACCRDGVHEDRTLARDTGSARQGALAGQSELSAALQGRRRARPVGGAVGRVRADRVHGQGGAGAELRDEARWLGRSARATQACRHRDARQPRAAVEAAAVGV